MTQKAKFAVYYGAKLARFSDYTDAMIFAHSKSAGNGLVEVLDATGLVGQFQAGRSTREFEVRWDQVRSATVKP